MRVSQGYNGNLLGVYYGNIHLYKVIKHFLKCVGREIQRGCGGFVRRSIEFPRLFWLLFGSIAKK